MSTQLPSLPGLTSQRCPTSAQGNVLEPFGADEFSGHAKPLSRQSGANQRTRGQLTFRLGPR